MIGQWPQLCTGCSPLWQEPTDAELAAKAELRHLEEELKHRRNARRAQRDTTDT